MAHEGSYPYTAGQGYQAVALPYLGGVSMVLLLPDAGQFDAFEAGLNTKMLQGAIDALNPRLVALAMPKFEYHSDSVSLKQSLRQLGMVDAFDPNAADFSGMDGKRDLYISDAFHKAMVRVDEDGTEAAAATGVAMGLTSAPAEPPLQLTIDRPFVFVIRDDATGAALFMGRITNPKAIS
jgi:serpin B